MHWARSREYLLTYTSILALILTTDYCKNECINSFTSHPESLGLYKSTLR